MPLPTLCTAIDDATTFLAQDYTTGSGVMVVDDASSFASVTPTTEDPTRIIVINGNFYSYYLCTNVTSNTLTVAIHDGTTDRDYPSESVVAVNNGAPFINDIKAYLTAGIQGPQGPQGFQGSQGFQGLSGSGSQGTQGSQGNQGATGVGSQGFQGSQGTSGATGPQGFQGSSGAGGSPGSPSGSLQYNNSGSFAGSSNLTVGTNPTLAITNAASSDVPLSIKMASGQSVNCFEIDDNGGSPQMWVDSVGSIHTSNYVYASIVISGVYVGSGSVELAVSGLPYSLTVDSNGTHAVCGNPSSQAGLHVAQGSSFVGTGTLNCQPMTSGSAGITCQANSGQSADLTQWQNSSGTPVSGVDQHGYIRTVITSGAPTTSPATGSMAFDPSTHTMYVYDGSTWRSSVFT